MSASDRNANNLCWKCQNALGGCEWTAISPETGAVQFEPVPGWIATPVKRVAYSGGHSYPRSGYHITYCPKFKPDEPRRKEHEQRE